MIFLKDITEGEEEIRPEITIVKFNILFITIINNLL